MATTTISVASFRNLCAECADAIEAEDWSLASKKCAKAEVVNAGLEVEGESHEQRYRRRETLGGMREAIAAVEEAVNKSANSGRRLITTRTRHGR